MSEGMLMDVDTPKKMTPKERLDAFLAKKEEEIKNKRLTAETEELERKKRVRQTDETPAFRRGHVHPSIVEQTKSLPIYAKRDTILQMAIDNQVIVIQGETGSGKSTQLVQYFAEAGFAEKGKILCTQPRRVAAKSMAKRVAKECGVKVGEMVGFVVRFEQQVSPSTIIKFVTDGTLVKEFSSDPKLENYSVIIVDEAHERSISSDVCLGLIKRILPSRPDLKVIISSATMNTQKFSAFFNKAPVLQVSGKMFDVKKVYEARDYEHDDGLFERSVNIIRSIVRYNPPGDILVFLCGGEEIDITWEKLEKDANHWGYASEIEIMPCHGSMPLDEQDRIFSKLDTNIRKIILSTNVAETSLTVDGIVYVVDTGYHKQREYNARTGIETLKPQRITKEMAIQRAGRAGRTQEGKVYRLYTEAMYETFLDSRIPDIQRCNMESTTLDLVSLGIDDIFNFPFLDMPDDFSLNESMIHLQELGALDEQYKITSVGRKMAKYPIDPPLAKTLLVSEELGCQQEVATIAALLSTQLHSLFKKGRKGGSKSQIDSVKTRLGQDSSGDHLLFLNIFQHYEDNNFSEYWCSQNFLNQRILDEAREIRAQLLEILSSYQVSASYYVPKCLDRSLIRKSFAAGYFRRIAVLPPMKKYEFLTFNSGEVTSAFIHPSSVMFKTTSSPQPHRWLLYHELRKTTKPFLTNCMMIEPEWIQRYAAKYWERITKAHGWLKNC